MKPLFDSVIFIQEILDTFDGSISIKNSKGEYFFVNNNWLNSFNFNKNEIIGKTDFEIFPKEIAEFIQNIDSEAYKKRKPIIYEKKIEFKDKQFDFVAIKFVVYFSHSDEPFFLCSIGDLKSNKKNVLNYKPKIKQLLNDDAILI